MFSRLLRLSLNRVVVGVPIIALGGSALLSTMSVEAAEKKVALSPKEFRSFKLLEVQPINYNTKLYRFSTNDAAASIGLTVASCLVTRAVIDGKEIIRPYTPTSTEAVTGHFDLVVKEYPTGVMSKHIASMKPGDSLEMKGPFPKVAVTTNFKKKIGMIAGGTGITPMLQVIDHMFADPADTTEVTLIFANVKIEDILFKDKLDHLAATNKRFKVVYVLENPPAGASFAKGRVSKEMLMGLMPAPSADSLVMVCGPPPMMNAISGDKAPDKSQGEVTGFLKELGYDSTNVFKF